MILENQTYTNSCPFTSISFQGNSFENGRGNEESTISRMRWDFHHQVRIRELEKIKAEKRRIFQINNIIEQILHSEFPKESDEAKNWAHNLVKLFDSSKKYETDDVKLREIFYLAEKFPNIGTLRLFYLAILNASSQSVRSLFEVDVWRFLHNILKFPNLSPSSKKNNNAENSPATNEKNLNTLFVEIEMVKAAIETFVCLFKKDVGFRDYSISIHESFSNHLKLAYRKYGESIKTEIIHFFKETFLQTPKKYSKEYLVILKSIETMIIDYRTKFVNFFNKKEWNDLETKETIQEVIDRASILMTIMYKIFTCNDKNWLLNFIEGNKLAKEYSYLEIVHIYLSFGECVLDQLLNNQENISEHCDLLEDTLDFMTNTFAFYNIYTEKMDEDGTESVKEIPDILKKAVIMLKLLKKCEENKVVNEVKKSLMFDIEKTKETCLFVIDCSLHSEFDKYSSFYKNFIFFENENGEEINLLAFLEYFLSTSYHGNVISELVCVIFSLFRMQVPYEEINKFLGMKEIMEKMCDLLADEFVIENTKEKICSYFLSYLEMDSGSLGSYLGIEEIFVNNIGKINNFMNSDVCSENSFYAIEKIIKILIPEGNDSLNGTVLI